MVKTIESKWLKNELLDTQRWEDEGGKIIESSAPPSVSPASLNAGRHHVSLQWNERFVIEPFQPNHGIFLIRKGKFNG